MPGTITFQKVAQRPAPSVYAASSCSRSSSIRTGWTARIVNGIVTKSMARTMPGVLYRTAIPPCWSQAPNGLVVP